ncbi:MAG: hypothetical protein B5M53_04675 [Candidatus Cloacimonas sp. 4484_209]|nr:MAG: hypothetical protein B5M53_04675 [Candidatus Cloacimonas sp. 4484_209]
MKMVILVASKRKKGNSSIVARLMENYSKQRKLDVKTLFLYDYRLEECDGCMSCVFKNVKCHLDDDFYVLIDEISSADFFILIAPTYVFSIPGVLKTFLDRFLLFLPYYKKNLGKQGATIGIASLKNWEHFQLPFLNTILLSLGFNIADSFTLFGAGPGEVLLDDEIDKKVESTINKLMQNKQIKGDVIASECPICHSRIFEYTDENFICPFCGTKAIRVDRGLLFKENDINNHRFTEKNLEAHFEEWILKTKEMFRSNLREVLRRKREMLRGV